MNIKKNIVFAEIAERTSPVMGKYYLRQRLGYIQEEVNEMAEALDEDAMIEYLDACADVAVLALNNVYHVARDLGNGVQMSVLMVSKVMEEVFRSNYSKIVEGKVFRDTNGKVQKPITYSKPDLEEVLQEFNIKDL